MQVYLRIHAWEIQATLSNLYYLVKGILTNLHSELGFRDAMKQNEITLEQQITCWYMASCWKFKIKFVTVVCLLAFSWRDDVKYLKPILFLSVLGRKGWIK